MLYISNADYKQGMEYLDMVEEVLNNDNDSFLRSKESIANRKKEVRECRAFLINKYDKTDPLNDVPGEVLEDIPMIDKIVKDNVEDETSESIPKSKRKYLNPANGKLVGYQRAKKLGLV